MSVYKLLTNVTAVQAAPTATRGPMNPVQAPGPDNANMPAQNQAFALSVTGIGAVSVTVQPVVSNDGATWIADGDPVTASGTDLGLFPWGGSRPWAWFGAYVTAISGTNASANLLMSA